MEKIPYNSAMTDLSILFDEPLTKLINIKTGAPYDVLIGRPSIWGNPYSHLDGTLAIYRVATREEAVNRYREHLINSPDLLRRLPELQGKTLGCWCLPKLCHGLVILEFLNRARIKE